MPVPRRISFLITELDHGGAERALVRIVTGLDRSLWEPQVISLNNRGPLTEPLKAAGIPVTAIGAGRVRSPRGLWRATIGLTQCLKEQRPEVLQTFLFHANITGRLAAKRAGVPVVVSGIRVAEKRGRWRLTLDRLTDHLVSRHVCVSQSVADFSISESGLPESKVVVIPNGVDVERFALVVSLIGIQECGDERLVGENFRSKKRSAKAMAMKSFANGMGEVDGAAARFNRMFKIARRSLCPREEGEHVDEQRFDVQRRCKVNGALRGIAGAFGFIEGFKEERAMVRKERFVVGTLRLVF